MTAPFMLAHAGHWLVDFAIYLGPAVVILVGVPLTILLVTEILDVGRKRRTSAQA